LKVPLGKDGFFLEAHKKLRPAEFMTDGVFICGAAHAPKDVQECVESALAAAGKAAILLAKGKVRREPITVELDEQLCSGCRICEGICPFGALTLDYVKKTITVNGILCKGCGACVSACPTKALNQNCFENNQITAMIRSLSTWGHRPEALDMEMECEKCD
jgi:heterodisulfide reductase subunit A